MNPRLTVNVLNVTPSRWAMALTLSFLISVSCVISFLSVSWADDTELAEEKVSTPVSEFAPNEVRPTEQKKYDQALTISQVSVSGNYLIDDHAIKDSMALQPGSLYSKRNLQGDLRRIYDLGYFTDKIKAVPVATRQGIHLRIEVEENAPVTGIQIQGNSILDDAELQAVFDTQTGLPQNIGQLNESIAKIEKIYADKGYVLARVKTIEDDPDGMINLDIDEGHLRNIHLVGNRKTKDYVVERLMTIKEGDVYNEKNLTDDLKRIFSTQSFSDVRRVIAVSPDDPDEYDLTIEMDEKKTGAISLGGGVDTGTGLFGSVGYNDPNFGGRGESFSSVASVGTGVIGRGDSLADARTYQFEVGWNTPSFRQTNHALGVSTYARDMSSINIPLGIERRIGSSVTWSKPLENHPHMAFSIATGAEHVSLREGGAASDLTNLGITGRDAQLNGGTFLNITPTIAYDTRNNRFDPSSGWLNSVALTGAYGLGGESYGTLSTNIRKYKKITDNVTLALNAQAGTNLIGDVPEFNMFRMGGSYSVRGFQEGGLGIGNGFMMGSAELRTKLPLFGKLKDVPFLDTMKTAFFLDAGQLVDQSKLTSGDYAQNGFGASVGAGLRVNIPGVGPIRIDYAVPIAGGNSQYYRRFNFGVGQKF